MILFSSYCQYSSHLIKQVATVFLLVCIAPCFVSAQKKIEIHFVNKVGNDTLQLGKSYVNTLGETFTVYKFKFYIHNIQLADSSNQFVTVDKSHYLIDAAERSSLFLRVNGLPGKKVSRLRFTVGVDSVLNTNGVQTGVLDPLKGMFWTWNTAYIYAKLEGKSNMSRMPGNIFSFDVGGYKPGENAVRVITLPIGDDSMVIIATDILKWFEGSGKIHIASNAVCHEPGVFAMQLADNYKNMFSVSHP